jgi:hypothetical protein
MKSHKHPHRSNAPPSETLRGILNRAKHELPKDAHGNVLSPNEVASAIAKGVITREVSCDGKKRYRTFEYADHEIRPILEKRYAKVYVTYPCPYCQGFHLASCAELAA